MISEKPLQTKESLIIEPSESLTELHSVEDSDLRYNNYGYVKGQIVSVEENPLNNGKFLYMVKPAVSGLYKKPIRVATSVSLKVGRNYHFKGYLDTVIKDKRLIPYLSVTRIKRTKDNKLNINKFGRVSDRVKECCFFALSSLTVKSITPVGENSLYIVLHKSINLGYRINVLKINCLSMRSTKYLSSLKEGDVIDNVILAMYINNDRGQTHFNEKSLHIVEYNLPQDKLIRLMEHIDKRF